MSADAERPPDDEPEPEPDPEPDNDRAKVDMAELEDIEGEVHADPLDDQGDPTQPQQGFGETPEGIEDNITFGTVYCNGLGLGIAACLGNWGDDSIDQEDTIEQYSRMAQQVQLDDYMDEYIRQHGRSQNLSPGRAVTLFSGLIVLCAAIANPDAIQSAIDDFNGTDEPVSVEARQAEPVEEPGDPVV